MASRLSPRRRRPPKLQNHDIWIQLEVACSVASHDQGIYSIFSGGVGESKKHSRSITPP